jgi:glutamate/tyrosine decarboxylase-like PLP-dependent enzyme
MNADEALLRAAREAIAYRKLVENGSAAEIATFAQELDLFDAPLPEEPTNPEQVIEELVSKASPGLRSMTSPTFFGWVIGGSHLAGVAADWLTSAWGQNAGNFAAAPAAAAAEQVAANWLLELLDLPRAASIGFVTGATMANFVALAAARGEQLRQADWDVEKDGLFGAPHIEVLIGRDAHATVYSALRYLGFGSGRVTVIESDDAGRMRPDSLEAALAVKKWPAIVIAQAGQINTGACDPFAEICSIAHARGAWVHVDGAFGLWAQASKQLRHLTRGVEEADSWATDGHKWLQTPYDSGFAIVRDPRAHRRSMGIEASYLPGASEGEREPSAYVPELSRRARGFAAWTMIRTLGRSGIAAMIERHCRVAAAVADVLARTEGIEVVVPVELNQLIVRFGDTDEATLATVAEVQRRGRIFVGPAQWRGQWVMRLSVTNFETGPDQVPLVQEEITSAWETVQTAHRAEGLAAAAS